MAPLISDQTDRPTDGRKTGRKEGREEGRQVDRSSALDDTGRKEGRKVATVGGGVSHKSYHDITFESAMEWMAKAVSVDMV